MTVKIGYVGIPPLTSMNDVITYNPNRTKLIMTTGIPSYLQIYRGNILPAVAPTVFFYLWGTYQQIVSAPPYLTLTGEMSHGGYGARSPMAIGNWALSWIEEIEEKKPLKSREAPPLNGKKKTMELRGLRLR